jgi:hypothetical protein
MVDGTVGRLPGWKANSALGREDEGVPLLAQAFDRLEQGTHAAGPLLDV